MSQPFPRPRHRFSLYPYLSCSSQLSVIFYHSVLRSLMLSHSIMLNVQIVVNRLKEPCSPGRGLLLFSSTPPNETGDMPRGDSQTVPVTLW